MKIPPPRENGFTTTTPAPLYWARYGKSEAAGRAPILVLHGGPGAEHDYLLPQMLALADTGRDLVFYDQRGGGRSKTDDRSPITWRTQVDDLALVARELDVNGAQGLTIVGYSWGALLGILYAIEAAAGRVAPAVGRLVLIDPAPVTRAFRETFEKEFAARQAGPIVKGLRDELNASGLKESDPDAYRQRSFELSVAGYFADPRRAHDLTPFRVVGRVQQSIWESLGEFDLTKPGQLDTIRIPTLIVHGRQDPIPLASSEAAARAIGTPLKVLENCGHVPYVEQPEQLFQAVHTFLTAG
jgi:proline iminopeptidase